MYPMAEGDLIERTPSMVMVPLRLSQSAQHGQKVDLPHPEGPTIARNSPGDTSNDI